MLPSIAPSLSSARCSRRRTPGRPVTVITVSARAAAFSIVVTSIPSYAASSARTGSISTTSTTAPSARSVRARLRPHQPKPTTANVLPATNVFVARKNPSTVAGPMPALALERELDRRVVDHDDRVRDAAGQLPGEAQAARGRLLGRGEHARRAGVHRPGDEVGAVVEQHVRVAREDARDVLVVGRGVVRLEGVDPEVRAGRHRGRDAVVGRRRAAGPRDLRAAREQRLHEDRGLRLDVEAHPDPVPGERAVALHLRAQPAEHRHVGARPGDPPLALRRRARGPRRGSARGRRRRGARQSRADGVVMNGIPPGPSMRSRLTAFPLVPEIGRPHTRRHASAHHAGRSGGCPTRHPHEGGLPRSRAGTRRRPSRRPPVPRGQPRRRRRCSACAPLAGRRLTELASPLEASWLEQWDRAIRTGEPQRADQPSADGTRWFDCTVTPIGGERAALVFHDVTDHHAVEASCASGRRAWRSPSTSRSSAPGRGTS